MDLIDLAGRIVAERFPDARAAVLAGSAGEDRATAYSDLDIVVVLEGPPAPYRETIRAEGWPVELFVQTPESIEHFTTLERGQGYAILARMLAIGQPLGGPDLDRIQQEARAFLAAGPPTWSTEQIDYRRYLITDALDDLSGARDDDERDAVANQLLTMAAELHLGAAGHWAGKGKWLLRFLRESDRELADRLYAGHRAVISSGDARGLIAVCDTVLAPLGGRLTEGFAVR